MRGVPTRVTASLGVDVGAVGAALLIADVDLADLALVADLDLADVALVTGSGGASAFCIAAFCLAALFAPTLRLLDML